MGILAKNRFRVFRKSYVFSKYILDATQTFPGPLPHL